MSEQHEWDFTGVSHPTVKEIRDQLSEQHEWTPGKTFYLSCGICGVDRKFHKESNKWLSGEALKDYDKVIHVGGRGFGKTKMVADIMENIERTKECIEEVASALNYANEVAEDYGFKVEVESGTITVEHYDETSEEGEIDWTKKFRLVEVRD